MRAPAGDRHVARVSRARMASSRRGLSDKIRGSQARASDGASAASEAVPWPRASTRRAGLRAGREDRPARDRSR